MIDSKAIIDPSANIASDVCIGPYSVIGPNVEIGAGSWLGPHVVITRNTKLGRNNKIYQFASIGGDNQDKLADTTETYLEIGDNNIFHEFVTVNRGSIKENCVTKIGDDNFMMAYSHIGHDCIIGSNTIFANGATLAGHVNVGDAATIGAFCAIHQFCNIGAYSFVARGAMVVQDVLPYLMVAGNDPKASGLNKVGLTRNGFSKADIRIIFKAYKVIFRESNTVEQAQKILVELAKECSAVQAFIDGLNLATRGIVR
jgi:UDP-N-acetylglucosamine acyltransferase